jgi:hypothetical protein
MSLEGAENNNEGMSLMQKLSNQAEELVEAVRQEAKQSDLLGTKNLESFEVKVGLKLQEKAGQKALDSGLTRGEMERIITEISNILATATVNEERMGAEILVATTEDERIICFCTNAILHATQKVEKWLEKKSSRSAEDGDYGGEELSEEQVKNKKMDQQGEKLLQELAMMKVLEKRGWGDLKQEEVQETVNKFMIFEHMRKVTSIANNKVCSVLRVLCKESTMLLQIDKAVMNPVGDNTTLEGALGLSTSAAIILNKVRTNRQCPTPEAYRSECAKHAKSWLDFNGLGENGGMSAFVTEVQLQQNTITMLCHDLKSNDKTGHATEGLENLVPHLFHTLASKIDPEGLLSNPTTKGANYDMLRHELRDIYKEVSRMEGTLDDKTNELVDRLRALDSTFGHLYVKKMKQEKETFGINVKFNGKGGKGGKGGKRGKGGKGESKQVCIGTARKGSCSREGCTYRAMSKEEFEGRQNCKEAISGNCPFGSKCKFRHPGDPTIMTEEMQRNCVHHRGHVGAVHAEEVEVEEKILLSGGRGGGRPGTPALE